MSWDGGWVNYCLIPNGPHHTQYILHIIILTPEGYAASSTHIRGSWVGLGESDSTCKIKEGYKLPRAREDNFVVTIYTQTHIRAISCYNQTKQSKNWDNTFWLSKNESKQDIYINRCLTPIVFHLYNLVPAVVSPAGSVNNMKSSSLAS